MSECLRDIGDSPHVHMKFYINLYPFLLSSAHKQDADLTWTREMNRRTNVNHMAVVAGPNMLNITLRKRGESRSGIYRGRENGGCNRMELSGGR